jgi:hypothetical protein
VEQDFEGVELPNGGAEVDDFVLLFHKACARNHLDKFNKQRIDFGC